MERIIDAKDGLGGGGGSDRPLGVGIVGLGRSGWNIHVPAIKRASGKFRVSAVMDPEPSRAEEAGKELGCVSYTDVGPLLENGEVDVVVVASPNHLHADHSIAAMRAGKHVVNEKPFAIDLDSADRMIEVADETGRVLAPFQNRRFEAHYLKVQELIRSGALGDVLQIRMCWHRFTRRWDWQSLSRFGGGVLFNNGTHLLDQALPLFGDAEPEIFIDLQRGLSMGDAEEHMKLILKAEGSPTIDIELSNASAFEQDRWHIMGTGGGLRGTMDRLEWKTVDWSTMPERVVDTGPAAGRLYPAEDIAWSTHEWVSSDERVTPYVRFYEDLYGAVRRGRPLRVTAESARRYVEVLERCRSMVAAAV